MGFMDKLKGAAESAQAATSKVGVGASAGQMDLANRAKKLMNEGVDTPAHIDSMESTGNTDTAGRHRVPDHAHDHARRRRRLPGDDQPVHLPLGAVRRPATT